MKRLLLVISIASLTFTSGCLYAVRYDGDYHGKVVDQETREPIEGAVVLGEWAVYHFGLAGGYTTFFAGKEAVTDKDGKFTILGHGLRIFTNVGPMGALIFKAGYTDYQTGSWTTIKTGLYSSKEVMWDGDIPVFPLRKLSKEERKNYPLPTGPVEALDNAKYMNQEINKERIYRGLEPTKF